jgi:phosphoglycolate phosphatase
MNNEFDTLVFDYNGTLVDDVDLCLNLLNKMLKANNHKEVTKKDYLNIFTFPIKEYYRQAGFDFDSGKDDFAKLAYEFDKDYRAMFINCPLFDDVISCLSKLKQTKRLLVLSATKEQQLDEQLRFFKIRDYFDDIIGIKDIYANSKLQEAIDYFSTHEFNPKRTLFIGDTIHDLEVASTLNARCALVARGHQSKKRLEQANPFVVTESIEELIPLI